MISPHNNYPGKGWQTEEIGAMHSQIIMKNAELLASIGRSGKSIALRNDLSSFQICGVDRS